MREYNVALKKGVDYDTFWNQMENVLPNHAHIPERAVNYTNERIASERQCWYLLTDAEAEILKNDDRVYCVEIPPEHRTDIQIGRKATEIFDFNKTVSSVGAVANWGLIRANSLTNPYGTGTNTNENYTYNLAGRGVDVVIQDSGLQVNHPEFIDENGISRVQQIDWAAASGLPFTQNVNHYRDYSGHGTHCAGITAGKTYGWAKKANVYSLKVSGLEGSGDGGTGIDITYCFDAIKLWHIGKSGSRPTVVNMSWGYSAFYTTISKVNYRGVEYSDSNTTGNANYRQTNYGIINNFDGSSYSFPIRVGSVDVDVEELIDAGVVVCIAAGNSTFKIDTSVGSDYNNQILTNNGWYYYHQGSSPYSPHAFMVGSLDSSVYDTNTDKKAYYSCSGPGVDLYSPGTNILSCTSTINEFSALPYYANLNFKQVNISGTSMATPQVTGIAALYSEYYPNYTPSQIKNMVLNDCGNAIYTSGQDNDWTNFNSLLGGTQTVVYNRFNNPITLKVTGNLNLNVNLNIYR